MCIYTRKHALCAYTRVCVWILTLWSKLQVFECILRRVGRDCVSCQTGAGEHHPHWSGWSGSPKQKKKKSLGCLDCCSFTQWHYVTSYLSSVMKLISTWLLLWTYCCFDWTWSQSNTTLHAKEMKIFSTSNSLAFVLPGFPYNTYLNARKLKMLQTTKVSLTSFKRNVLSWLARRCQNFVKSGRLSRSPTSARWSFKTNSISHAEAERPSVGASSFWDGRASHLLSTG